MYAVVKTGGKQYTVSKGDSFRVEKLLGEVGATVELKDVVAVGEGKDLKVGTPLVDGASILCEITEQDRGKKIVVFKKKRRKGYTKKQGHRQDFTALIVKDIKA
ncbi:MAG: 50S ribosomal protein L21 [Deltaproteobacteria bacterium]|nr:50S ribosomal protein L21 [Deltaproteobacteria bacterium]